MPNWVKQKVTLYGNHEKVEAVLFKVLPSEDYINANKAFNEAFELPKNLAEAGFKPEQFMKKTEFRDTDVTFDILLPQPDMLFRDALSNKNEELLDKLGVPNWYKWNRNNWGCKWDASESTFEWLDDDTAEITFWTPWEHAENWLSALADECTKHSVLMCGLFANEDFGCLMGDFDNNDGTLSVYYSDYDSDIYEYVWGESPDGEEC